MTRYNKAKNSTNGGRLDHRTENCWENPPYFSFPNGTNGGRLYHIFFSISIHNGDQGLTKVFLMLKYSNGMPYSLIRFPPKFLVWSVCFGPSHIIDRWTLVHPVCVLDQPPLSTTTTRSRRFYKLMHGRLYVSDTFTNFVRSNARA